MTRYFVDRRKAPRSSDAEDWEPYNPTPIPNVCDHEPTFTGLLDAFGDPIMKAPRPIGFGRDDEW